MCEKEKRLEKQRNYQKEWRKKNKDKVRKYNERFWEKKVVEAAAQEKQEGDNGGS